MKKKLAAAMAVVMIVGLSGCSLLGGSKFKKTSDKIVKAAKSACGAEEADKKAKKSMIKNFDPSDDAFEDGVYYEFSSDDVEDFKFELGDKKVDTDDIKNVTMFGKNEDGRSMIVAVVLEAADEGAAEDLFEDALSMTEDLDEKQLKSAAKNSDLEYNIDDESDDKFVMAVYSEDYGMAVDYYMVREGKI
ncbi:MAG: hypothetical protein J5750_01120, partial [Clostridiales bacterium]|nr:hypothetical protein [Clostridiales bacterium]